MSQPRMSAYHTALFAILVSGFTEEIDSMPFDLVTFFMGTTAMLFFIFLGNDRLKGFNKWRARGVMLIHYGVMLALFLLVSFVVKPAFIPLPDSKVTTALAFIVYGLIFFISSKILIKLSSMISDGAIPRGMPHWRENIVNESGKM